MEREGLLLLGERTNRTIPRGEANRRTLVKRGCPPKRVVRRRQDVEYKERRRGPRYPFIASAELIEQKADVRIASRISELSQNGCYLDMMNPFPQGTMGWGKFPPARNFFKPKGRFFYPQLNMEPA